MTDIILSVQNNKPVVSSRQIAKNFEKRHDHVMRDIDTIKKDVPNFGEMFFENTEPDTYGRPQRTYLMNRDGFSLLVMGFTGKAEELYHEYEKLCAEYDSYSFTAVHFKSLL